MITLRIATASDGAACAAIYAPFAEGSVITFEEQAPNAEEFARRIEAVNQKHGWIIAEDGAGTALGYAYYSKFRERPAYRWVVESSIYLRPIMQAKGLGTALYRTILDLAALQGYWRCYGVVTQPNAASDAIHGRLGFTLVGVWPQSGFKQGRWLDVALYDKSIREDYSLVEGVPPEPLDISLLPPHSVADILQRYNIHPPQK